MSRCYFSFFPHLSFLRISFSPSHFPFLTVSIGVPLDSCLAVLTCCPSGRISCISPFSQRILGLFNCHLLCGRVWMFNCTFRRCMRSDMTDIVDPSKRPVKQARHRQIFGVLDSFGSLLCPSFDSLFVGWILIFRSSSFGVGGRAVWRLE